MILGKRERHFHFVSITELATGTRQTIIYLRLFRGNMINRYSYYKSPLGTITMQANENGLLGAWFETQTTQPQKLGVKDDNFPLFSLVNKQFDKYFDGKMIQFSVPLTSIGTPFQKLVWNALIKIPYGVVCNYSQLARSIGSPKAVRAVGSAVGKNPISIIVPCHRVIGINGKLCGYAGGLKRKQSLLETEGVFLKK